MESLPEVESDLSQFQWDAVALRMTAFPKPGSEVAVNDWWKSVVGEPPEQRTEQPRTGEIMEHAEHGNGRLELQVTPVSLSWTHKIVEIQPEKETATLGEFQRSCDKFCAMMSKWFDLDTVPNLIRLAFGSILIQPVQSQEAGLERLDRYIQAVKLDPALSSDFLYQINRRRASNLEIEGLAINRIMKWSMSQHQFFLLHPAGRENVTQAPPENFVRLEMDINTIHEFEGEFQREHLAEVFGELVELSAEIAEKGDVP